MSVFSTYSLSPRHCSYNAAASGTEHSVLAALWFMSVLDSDSLSTELWSLSHTHSQAHTKTSAPWSLWRKSLLVLIRFLLSWAWRQQQPMWLCSNQYQRIHVWASQQQQQLEVANSCRRESVNGGRERDGEKEQMRKGEGSSEWMSEWVSVQDARTVEQ